MMREESKAKGSKGLKTIKQKERLSYTIMLCQLEDSDAPEQILGRAISRTLARAIFEAACREHPDRRIILCRGKQILSDSSLR